jgi:hypothetical protein
MAPKKPQKQNNVLNALAALGAAVVVASLAFVSLELALVAAGFFVTVGYVMNDIRRRKFWENGLSFRMKGLSDNISSLSQKVTGTRQDILNSAPGDRRREPPPEQAGRPRRDCESRPAPRSFEGTDRRSPAGCNTPPPFFR